jgi:hypothetical protein
VIMSIECEICDSTIFIPDTVWYAGTVFGHRSVTLCGACASCIPIEKRKSFESDAPFTVTFGMVSAEPGPNGHWYNGAGAVNGPVRFTASTEAIDKYLPNSRFLLHELSPYYRIDWYVTQTVEEYLKEKESGPAAREKAVEAVRRYFKTLYLWSKWQEAHQRETSKENQVIISDEELNRENTEKLFDDLVEIVGKGIHPD